MVNLSKIPMSLQQVKNCKNSCMTKKGKNRLRYQLVYYVPFKVDAPKSNPLQLDCMFDDLD